MQKRGKPSLFLSVILPIILLEILLIVCFFFAIIVGDNMGVLGLLIIILTGTFFLIGSLLSILIYLLRYSSYEKVKTPNGKLNVPCLVGFIMAAGSYVLSGVFGWIPIVGVFFGFMIIAGGIASIVGLSTFKEDEKGRGFGNIGTFLGIYYIIHLIISIILVIVLFVVVTSTLQPVQ